MQNGAGISPCKITVITLSFAPVMSLFFPQCCSSCEDMSSTSPARIPTRVNTQCEVLLPISVSMLYLAVRFSYLVMRIFSR